MMTHLIVIAGCFPNCTPAPGSGVTSGSLGTAPLGAAAVLLFVLFLMRKK
jgi:CBS-domain-containing membrane protein